jgi:hypothetical protein
MKPLGEVVDVELGILSQESDLFYSTTGNVRVIHAHIEDPTYAGLENENTARHR